MKKLFTIIAFFACITTSYRAVAQTGENADMMKMWMEYMTPGNFHKMMAKSDGKWAEETTMWMEPNGAPVKSLLTAENKMILGGRYQQSTHKGMMNGMPFEGISTVGYDNTKKVFVNTWVDNMGTGVMYMEGKFDPVMKNITFKGKMADMMTGKEKDIREVFTMVDDDTQTISMFDTSNGKEYKSMEIKLTRKK